MPKVRVIGRPYGRRAIGDEFTVTGAESRVLVALKRVEVATDSPTYQTKVVKAEDDVSPRTGKQKRKYKRRDMKAED